LSRGVERTANAPVCEGEKGGKRWTAEPRIHKRVFWVKKKGARRTKNRFFTDGKKKRKRKDREDSGRTGKRRRKGS